MPAIKFDDPKLHFWEKAEYLEKRARMSTDSPELAAAYAQAAGMFHCAQQLMLIASALEDIKIKEKIL